MPQGTGDLETVGVKAGQYKIPISSANITTPIYLGEVQTTRRVKKLVLTGDENWVISAGWKKPATSVFYMALANIIHISADSVVFIYSNTFSAATRNELYNGDSNMVARTGTEALTMRVSDSIATTVADFKSYLQQQYAAGTPVTMWYVLATEETAVVNEPLMKIGDYADTLSMEQAGVSIPTANGSTTLGVETTVPPSEVYIKYRGEAVATLSALPAEVSSPEANEEVNPEETEEEENGSEDISLQREFEAIE
jgi:hypothetical protein